MRKLWGLLTLLSFGCQDSLADTNPTTLRDQSGAVFDWNCAEDRCRPEPQEDAPYQFCPDAERQIYSYAWSRFFEITAACAGDDGGWGALPQWSRLVVCESDAECPQRFDAGRDDAYECRAGFCQHVDLERFAPDILPSSHTMYQLCFGDMPRFGDESDLPGIFAAVDEACPDSGSCLRIPDGCPDPRTPRPL